MHGTKAFDDRRNDGIKEMLRRLRSEMRSDAASAPCGNDPAPPPLVQQSAGGLALIFDDGSQRAQPPCLPRIQLRRKAQEQEEKKDRSPPLPSPKKQAAPTRVPAGSNKLPLREHNGMLRDDGKSECVARVEELQAKREARRKLALEARQQRAHEEAAAVEAGVGVEHVDFLRLLASRRRELGLVASPPRRPEGAHVWRDLGDTSRIRVCVRKRPMLHLEKLRHDVDIVDVARTAGAGGDGGVCQNFREAVHVHEPITRVDCSRECSSHSFGFDAVFSEADTNEEVYEAAVRPLIDHVVRGTLEDDRRAPSSARGGECGGGGKVQAALAAGGTATIFAFGQTGSGDDDHAGRATGQPRASSLLPSSLRPPPFSFLLSPSPSPPPPPPPPFVIAQLAGYLLTRASPPPLLSCVSPAIHRA